MQTALRSSWIVGVALVLGALAIGCAAGAGPCEVGSARCGCTAGGACDPGLVCVSDRCVASSDHDAGHGDAGPPSDAGADDAGAPPDAGPLGPCNPSPCLNGATCSVVGGAGECACAPGFEGPTCATNVDDCSPNPCQHGGTCTDGVDAHTCACTTGFAGDECELLDCATGLTECAGECVDLLTDARYCSTSGACGSGCATGQRCVSGSCVAPTPTVFAYTGAMQSFVVPAGVSSITVTADGASGGDGWNVDVDTPLGTGGLGGRVVATLAVTPGETLYLFVGGAGGDATATVPGAAGWNGGGAGGPSPYGYSGGGGGGASDIRRGGTALGDRILVAGGGGSGSGWCTSGDGDGGAGGGLSGASGLSCVGIAVGTGGTQSAGGTLGGSLGTGGTYPGSTQAASAGGGGYYGGGASHGSGGGGGSSFAAPTATAVTHAPGVVDGNGTITLVL